ncbi:MAG TPA: GNAT family N-acetyltransferase [Gemmatimonadetes bacterium]|nr:GNAT family N-acetyltransferase [Gemmatimonadota bacterium]
MRTIRASRSSDREELVRMLTALWPDYEEAEVDDLLRVPISAGILLVGEREGGGLCAFAQVGQRSCADGCVTSPVAYLEGIWTDADVRRSGLASELVREANAWARSRGLTEFASDCELENHESEAFHLAVGFQEEVLAILFRRDVSPE